MSGIGLFYLRSAEWCDVIAMCQGYVWGACSGNGCAEVAYRAQQLLEHSLLSELRAIVARALSGLDMFAGGQLSELDLLGSDFLETPTRTEVRTPVPGCFHTML